ncbi:MAG: FtsQ-type POTRA domain-containing protein [Caulobacteraceae bacterium]|nr:FtsQ-type POTRA domain-containing protein [Caulobacteraceae bacterium]
MAAALRGGARSQAKPRASKPAAARRPASRAPGGYAPGKLGAVSNIDLPPKFTAAVVAGVVVLGLVAGLVPEHRGQKMLASVGSGFDGQLGRMGLRVQALTIQGASPMAQADIARAAGVFKDQPLVGLDLQAVKRNVEQVGWVKSARVVRLFPDTIVIAVTERDSLAVWQHAGRTVVVDSSGQPIPEADPARFPDLPLVVGEGANEAVGAILPILRNHPAVLQRLEALVRVDGRRWDLRTRDGGLIQLPAVGEDSALIELDQLNQKSRILELGFERIDLRDPEMAAVRPRTASPAAAPNGV